MRIAKGQLTKKLTTENRAAGLRVISQIGFDPRSNTAYLWTRPCRYTMKKLVADMEKIPSSAS